MSQGCKITDQDRIHYMTFQIVEWVDGSFLQGRSLAFSIDVARDATPNGVKMKT